MKRLKKQMNEYEEMKKRTNELKTLNVQNKEL
jgi:hypothetical protein